MGSPLNKRRSLKKIKVRISGEYITDPNIKLESTAYKQDDDEDDERDTEQPA